MVDMDLVRPIGATGRKFIFQYDSAGLSVWSIEMTAASVLNQLDTKSLRVHVTKRHNPATVLAVVKWCMAHHAELVFVYEDGEEQRVLV